ncbi:MAG: hypothetical protein IPL20_02960 [Saprospiraceae bacterium]|nr:hypothetical protein [Saprospiraceae bacterium]
MFQGTYNTQLIDAQFSKKHNKLRLFISGSLMSSKALLLDNRIPLDYDPYTRELKSEHDIYPTENNDGVRYNFSAKIIYDKDINTQLSLILSYELEQGKNPPLFHDGINFSPTDIQSRISSGRLTNSDYSTYPFNEKWGGIIDNSSMILSLKFEKILNNKNYLNIQPFVFITNRYRKDHNGSWFF